MQPKYKNLIKLVWVNFKVLLLFILCLEIVGQLIYLFNHHELRLTARPIPKHEDSRLTFEKYPYFGVRLIPGKVITSGSLKFSANAQSRRPTGADEKDTTKIRIACVGGSSTYCSRISDEQAWPSLLQKKLGANYAVYNYGMLGYGTTEAILQTALLLPEIKPEMVIYYEGWNDLRCYHDPESAPDFHKHSSSLVKGMDCDDDELKCYTAFDAVTKFSGFIYMVQIMRNHVMNYLSKKGLVNLKPVFKSPGQVYDTPDPEIDRLYFRNLVSLRAIALAHQTTPLFIPQVMDPQFYLEGNPSLPWTPYIGSNSLAKLMAHFNTVMDSMCVVYNCDEIKDIHKDYKWTSDCFVDEGHFSEKGSEQFAEIVYQKIKKLKQVNAGGL